MVKKINITIDDELLSRVDKFADQNYLSRSGLMSMALHQFLLQQEAEGMFRTMALAMQRIADTGVIDDKTRQELDDIMRICNMLQGK